MKLLIAAALLALTASPAYGMATPPWRYAGPFVGKLTETRLPLKEVEPACHRLFGANGLPNYASRYGCAFLDRAGACTIILIDRDAGGVSARSVRRHELAHCNGWPANHPR